MGMSGVDALARLRHVFLNPDDCNRVKNSARSLAVLSSSTIGLRNMRLTRQSKEPRFRTYASPQTGMSQAFMR